MPNQGFRFHILHQKESVEKTYARRGEAIVARNFAAIDHSLARLAHVTLGSVTDGSSCIDEPCAIEL